MLQIDLEYNIDFELECPQLDERLQSLAVVARSHTVYESCVVAMHYRGIVPLCIIAINFIPPAQFHAPFMHALYTFKYTRLPRSHAPFCACFVCIINSSMTFHQLDSHVATPHFVCASCVLAMFFEYKSHFTCSHAPVLEIQSGLQNCQID